MLVVPAAPVRLCVRSLVRLRDASLIHTLLLPGSGHPEELVFSLYATSGMSEEKLCVQDTFAGRGRRSWSWSSYGRLALHDDDAG